MKTRPYAVVAGIGLGLAMFAAGCASPSYRPGKVDLSGYSRVVVPKFEAGPAVQMPAEKNTVICNAAIDQIQKSGKFQDVDSKSTSKKGELIVQGKMMTYEPGNRFARLLPFMRQASFKAEICLKDGQTGQVLDKQTVSSHFELHGPIGVIVSEDMLIAKIGDVVGRGVSNAKLVNP